MRKLCIENPIFIGFGSIKLRVVLEGSKDIDTGKRLRNNQEECQARKGGIFPVGNRDVLRVFSSQKNLMDIMLEKE